MYDIDHHFIKKFEAIPEHLWTVQKFQRGDGTCCALGHCGWDEGVTTREGTALCSLFIGAKLSLSAVNDGDNAQFVAISPRDRILSALRWIKEHFPNA